MKKILAFAAVLTGVCTAAAVVLEQKYLNTSKKKFGGGPTEDNLNWLKTAKYEETYMIAHDGACLHASLFDSGSENWIILVHGYDAEWRDMLGYARKLLDEGYSVMMPDLRGFGQSEGNTTSMGHFEKYDVIEWTERLINDKKPKNIVLFGVSMGAATVMLTSAEKLPADVVAAIEDCGYTSVKEEFEYNMKHIVHFPPYPVLWICDIITRVKSGWSFLNDADCINAVRHARLPMLFIHGSEDDFVPFYMQDKLYSACTRPDKEKLMIDGAKHTEACLVDPEKYWNKVIGFVEKHLK